MAEAFLENTNENSEKRRGLSGNALKIIAMVTMLIDHIGAVFLTWGEPACMLMRGIGRLAFPIFAFLCAEGLARSKNLGKYMLRLFVFALISEPFYDLTFYGSLWYTESQNVLFTFLLAAIPVYILNLSPGTGARGGAIFAGAAVVAVSAIFSADYGTNGVLLVWIYYAFRKYPAGRHIPAAVFMLWAWSYGFRSLNIQLFAALAVLPMLAYTGRKGSGLPKLAGYVFYPGHLLLLYLLTLFV